MPVREIGEEKSRIKKLEQIKSKGINPYPSEVKRTHTCLQVVENFEKLLNKKIVLAGRITALRLHGKACFVDLNDGEARMQVYLTQDGVGEESYNQFKEWIDIGDFIEVQGKLFLTRKNEKTLRCSQWRILGKALLPLPEKWHGLKSKETRYRQRYLDLLANPKVRNNFIIRSLILKEVRNFLDEQGYLEVETPILQPLAGGAAARPFLTHLNALKMNLYLRIAPELYLKQLVIGGLSKVYEVAKCFRNEGIDFAHNPEFTQVEFYQAYSDYKDLMVLTEQLLQRVVKRIFNSLQVEYKGHKLSFKTPFTRLKYRDVVYQYSKIDVLDDEKKIKTQAKKKGMEIDKTWSKGKIIDEIFKEFVRPKIIQPTFIIDHPVDLSPLAKRHFDNPELTERFQLLIAGMEICNAFSELNDPLDQEKRFKFQEQMRKKGDEEAHPLDKEFVKALKYGLPPTAGEGLGIDRLTQILTNEPSIREIIFFPLMKRKTK